METPIEVILWLSAMIAAVALPAIALAPVMIGYCCRRLTCGRAYYCPTCKAAVPRPTPAGVHSSQTRTSPRTAQDNRTNQARSAAPEDDLEFLKENPEMWRWVLGDERYDRMVDDHRPEPMPEPTGPRARRMNPEIVAALGELGITASVVEWHIVQSRFRDIARQCHPDALATQQLPPESRRRAAERFDRAKQAYDFLKQYNKPLRG